MTIIRILGYKAEDSRNRIIAIKVVLREQGSKLARFSNEINFCERNQNKNIIEIYDHGTIGNNMIFYVMPLAKETLRDRIKKHIQHSDAEEIFINSNFPQGFSFRSLVNTANNS